MFGRVLLNSQGLKVSQSGVDVRSAGLGQLLFNSDWAAFSLYQSGTHNFTWSVNGNIGSYSGRHNFGKTFTTPPLVWFYKNEGGHYIQLGNTGGFNFEMTGSYENFTKTRRFAGNASVDASGISFEGFYDKGTDGWTQPQLNLFFYVFEYNL